MVSTANPSSRTLNDAAWLTAAPLRSVLAALAKGGGETRVIGGAVRNALLCRPVTDTDLATTLTPDAVTERATRAGLRVFPTGLAHGTVTVVADEHGFEVTTLRRDVQTDGRHAVVAFTTDWHEDAQRRDFTINALSCDAHGRVYDSVGGLADLDARRVRFIGNAEDRIREDYLRILRFFRFSAAFAEGAPDADGLAACARLKDGLERLSSERVGAELMKFVVTPRAAEIAAIMDANGILSCIVPLNAHAGRLARMQEIERTLGIAPDAIARLAALFMDMSSGASVLAARLRLSNADMSALETAADVNVTHDPAASEPEVRAQIYRSGAVAFARAQRVAWARSGQPSTHPAWIARSRLAASWSPPKLPFSGADVLALGVPAGPRVGRTLKAFEAWWISADFPDDREAQRARLAALAEQS